MGYTTHTYTFSALHNAVHINTIHEKLFIFCKKKEGGREKEREKKSI